jgi:hypothetical protein
MNLRFATAAFLAWLALVAAFVWTSAASLPSVVASHFDAAGTADAFMSRSAYRDTLLLLALAIPLLLAFLPLAATVKSGVKLNLPHRDYWLAPERRAQTLAFLCAHGLWFAACVALFLAYVHWLVVEANRLDPPRLSTGAMHAGLAAFFIALIAWLAVLHRRFRKPG